MSKIMVSRRELLQHTACGIGLGYASGWFPLLAEETATHPQRRRSCILLWMNGGPSQLDTFDLKPEHENGGEFEPIDTSVAGIQISEHLPKLARQMEHAAIIRSMSTKEGDHNRGTYLMRTGNLPQGPIRFPTLGSLLSKELGRNDASLPNFVSISPYTLFSPAAYGPGFLGPRYAPLVVGQMAPYLAARNNGSQSDAENMKIKNLQLPDSVDRLQANARRNLLAEMEQKFLDTRGGDLVQSHQTAYQQAVRMMRADENQAFNLEQETDAIREAYGRNLFGQGCLLARRLVERGVPFVEVNMNRFGGGGLGWDTHRNNFTGVKSLSDILDPAWSTLMTDLKERGLLENTLIVWMGEFGRTPKINAGKGRDHFPNAFSTVLAGGGIQGGQVIGKTSDDGMEVTERPVAVADLIATIAKAVGVDPMTQNLSNVGRPIRIADPQAKPIDEILL